MTHPSFVFMESSPVDLLPKELLLFRLHHLLSGLLQSPLIGTQPSPFLNTAVPVLLAKGRTALLKFLPFNIEIITYYNIINVIIEGNILHEASTILPGQVPRIISCLVCYLHLLMLWSLATVACYWFFIFVIICHERTFAFAILYGRVSPTPLIQLVSIHTSELILSFKSPLNLSLTSLTSPNLCYWDSFCTFRAWTSMRHLRQ